MRRAGADGGSCSLGRGRQDPVDPRKLRRLRQVAPVAIAIVLAGCVSPSEPPEGWHEDQGGAAHVQQRVFDEDSPWNLPIPPDPVLDPASLAMGAALGQELRAYAQLYEYGIPVFEVGDHTPRYAVECSAPWSGCRLEGEQVPIPPNARPNTGSDAAMVVIDRGENRIYEFWQARSTPSGGWETAWGGWLPLDGDGQGGVTGSGLSLMGGLVRSYEIRAGRIDHALAFASALSCRDVFRHPATKTDGVSLAPDCLPQGARIQLDPAVDVDAIPGITPGEKAVAEALQTYGAYLRDATSAIMAFAFEQPTSDADPYPVAAGFPWDFYDMPHIPWDRLRVLRQWDGR